jgi:RNA polymerase sigma factor (TIGR02999 family)
MADVTRILNAIEQGNAKAADELLPLVYEELRLLAAQKLSHESPGQTLQATALVHEAYLRLVGTEDQSWDNKGHFFKAAAEAMRRILIENARRKKTERRGGGQKRVELGESIPTGTRDYTALDEILTLDEALGKLEGKDPLKADLIKLRFYAGLTIEQSAKSLGISLTTAKTHWAYARAWLLREVG